MAGHTNKKRICIIGAGPSGLVCLYSLNKLEKNRNDFPEVVCYEKQSDIGGLWNYSWKTGLDEFGDPSYGSMYKHLWINAPKEMIEFNDYTFKDHFGHAVPSFAPRAAIKSYMRERYDRENVRRFIKFQFVVKRVAYHKEHDHFKVTVKDLVADAELETQIFSHVFVSTGKCSHPHLPMFKGIETFPGRVLHSRDYRSPTECVDKRVLVVGASFSADDIAVQCIKFGAKHVICSWHKTPMNFLWPQGIEERSPLSKVDGSKVYFNDGSSAEVDAIILCTGYKLYFHFLQEDLRLKCSNSLYPPDLYKGTVWLKGGNNKLYYIGMQNQCFTLPMLECQAEFSCSVAIGDRKLPSHEEMQNDSFQWLHKLQREVASPNDCLTFQREYLEDLCKLINKDYPWRPLCEIWYQWKQDKKENISEFRDKIFRSVFTGQDAVKPVKEWMTVFDDSEEGYLMQTY